MTSQGIQANENNHKNEAQKTHSSFENDTQSILS